MQKSIFDMQYGLEITLFYTNMFLSIFIYFYSDE